MRRIRTVDTPVVVLSFLRSLICIGVAMAILTTTMALADAQTILVGSVFPKTGLAAVEADTIRQAVELAAEKINMSGGLLGRQVELVEFDNQSTAIGSRQAAIEAVQAGVLAVVGPTWSSHAMAMASVLQEAKTLMIAATASAPGLTDVGDYIFRACYTDKLQAEVLANFALRDLKSSRVAILHIAQDVYSQGLANLFSEHFTQSGGTVVAQEPYLLDAMDFSIQLQKAAVFNPDLIFVPGYARDAAVIIRQARLMGLTMPLLGGDGWSISDTYPMSTLSQGDNYYVSHWSIGIQTPESKTFLRLFKERFPGQFHNLNPGAACGFDAMNLLAEAIRRAGTTETDSIRTALVSIQGFQGVSGTISFGPNRNPEKPLALIKMTPNGTRFVKMLVPEALQ